MKTPIVLPKKPVDGFEIIYFERAYENIYERKLIYFIKAPYSELFPGKTGALIENEWMSFRNGNCEGRIEYWATPANKDFFNKNDYDTLKDAQDDLVESLKGRIKSHQIQIEDWLRKIVDIEFKAK